MMAKLYDATGMASNIERASASHPVERSAAYADLPDLYRPERRRRVPPLIVAMAAFGIATAGFYGAEAMLPPDYKPSHFTGGYQREMAKAKAEGELGVKIAYDAKLKVIETQAAQWQETCRAGLQNWNNYYQAAYSRANAGFQLAASLQQQYAGTRLSTAQSSVGGEIGIANTATSLGYIIGLFDPESGQKTLAFAEEARQAALRKLDDAANSGIKVSADGWNDGLPDPSQLPPPVKCDLPASFVFAAQPSSGG